MLQQKRSCHIKPTSYSLAVGQLKPAEPICLVHLLDVPDEWARSGKTSSSRGRSFDAVALNRSMRLRGISSALSNTEAGETGDPMRLKHIIDEASIFPPAYLLSKMCQCPRW